MDKPIITDSHVARRSWRPSDHDEHRERKRNWNAGVAPAFKCPVCGTRMTSRTSEELSKLVRKLYYRCLNAACGLRGTAHLEWISTTSQSALGEVPLPMIRLKPLRNVQAPDPPPDLHAS